MINFPRKPNYLNKFGISQLPGPSHDGLEIDMPIFYNHKISR